MSESPKYEQFGINIEERDNSTHVFKNGTLIGSFTIDVEANTLKFNFPGHKFFNYFAYMASDRPSNRVKWVNENLGKDTMDNMQAGVAFLGFAKFEELMAARLAAQHMEEEMPDGETSRNDTPIH